MTKPPCILTVECVEKVIFLAGLLTGGILAVRRMEIEQRKKAVLGINTKKVEARMF